MSLLLQIFAWNGLYVLLASVSAALGMATLFALKYTIRRPISSYGTTHATEQEWASFSHHADTFSRVKDKGKSKGYGIKQLIECGLNYDTIYNEQKWNNNGTLICGKLDRVAYRRRRMPWLLFSDLIDPVICEVLNINQINGLEINLNWKEIQGGKFYGDKVLSCGHGLSTNRNRKGFSMIPGCSTVELLDASHLIVESLTSVNSKNFNSMLHWATEWLHHPPPRTTEGSEYPGWGT